MKFINDNDIIILSKLLDRLTRPAKFMPYLYVIVNQIGKHYVGITTLDPIKRLERHNKGDVFSTKLGRPWKLIKVEYFKTLQEARRREKQIKSWKGGNAFKNSSPKLRGRLMVGQWPLEPLI